MRVNTARALVNLTRAQNGCGGRNLLEHKECWSALAALLGANMPAAVVLEAMRAAAGLVLHRDARSLIKPHTTFISAMSRAIINIPRPVKEKVWTPPPPPPEEKKKRRDEEEEEKEPIDPDPISGPGPPSYSYADSTVSAEMRNELVYHASVIIQVRNTCGMI